MHKYLDDTVKTPILVNESIQLFELIATIIPMPKVW